MIDEKEIRKIVESVVSSVTSNGSPQAAAFSVGTAPSVIPKATPIISPTAGIGGQDGVFDRMEDAINASKKAFEEFKIFSVRDRERLISIVRRVTRDHAEEFSKMTYEETGMGNIKDKIIKHKNCAKNSPGTEDLVSRAWSGEKGVVLEEFAPFGIIGSITPSTHPVPTMMNNIVIMLASGNTVIFNPHPGAKKVTAYALQVYHKAVVAGGFPENLFSCVKNPTIDSANIMFKHPDVTLLSITGGPGVVKAAMSTNKKVIAAGPGNPPVLVDETANLDHAADCIIRGGSFDNNLLCISEKEVFVVESVFDKFMLAMEKAGAYRIDELNLNLLAKKAFIPDEKGGHVLNREIVGKGASHLGDLVKINVPEGTRMLFGETNKDNLFVMEEQMTSFMPVVRVKNFKEGLEASLVAERGYGHTAIIHSKDMDRITEFASVMKTTIVVANGMSTQGDGPDDGEAYLAFTIATPTGEGITSPRDFCKIRRLAVAGSLRFV
ncbi:MAG: aldehyde dehydrogenase [Candidatus Latescibacteria bacterium]|jgi:aldehyde dehydrogenase|nr:aldehyde dehydrogenase [Candidatus Latescibacterota bacterium]